MTYENEPRRGCESGCAVEQSNLHLEALRTHVDTRFDALGGQLDRVETHLDRLHERVEDHLGRLSRAEAAIEWLRGHVKISTIIFLGVVGTLAGWWFTQVSSP